MKPDRKTVILGVVLLILVSAAQSLLALKAAIRERDAALQKK